MRKEMGQTASSVGLSQTERFSSVGGKTLIPLLSGLAAIAMGIAILAVVSQTQERQKRLAKERELTLALAENNSLKTQVDDAQRARLRAEEETGRSRKELAQAQAELTKAVEAQQTLSRSVEEREQAISRITEELEQARSESKQALSQLTELQAAHQAAKQQMAELEEAKDELASKLAQLSGHPTVELETVRVANREPSAPSGLAAPAGVAGATASANGQVVVVNREYDFVVVNLGKNQGLSVGQEFQIVRGDAVLGKVKVEKVYDELSAAAILPESQKENIREGDLIKAL